MSTRSFNAAWQSTAPKGHNRTAQGFNPGYRVLERCALKGHQSRCTLSSLRVPYLARTRSSATFRAQLMATRYPGLKPWAVLLCPFGADDDSLSDEAFSPIERPRLLNRRSRKYEDDKGGTTPHP